MSHLIIDHRISLIAHDDLERMLSQVDLSDPDLLCFFEEEAAAELNKIEALLQGWDASKIPPLSDLNISFHTLKGAANSVSQLRIGALAAGMEDVLGKLEPKSGVLLQAEIIKASVLVMEAIKQLIQEANEPRHNAIKKGVLSSAVHSILELQRKVPNGYPL